MNLERMHTSLPWKRASAPDAGSLAGPRAVLLALRTAFEARAVQTAPAVQTVRAVLTARAVLPALGAALVALVSLSVLPAAAQSQAPRAQPLLPSPTPAQSAAAQAGTAPAGAASRTEPRRGGNPPPPFGGHAADQPLVSPPLPVVAGAVPWDLLGQVQTVRVKDRFVPEFSPGVMRLDRQDVRIVGFMMPLQPGERQSHFLLTVTSQTCAFCVPAGPEGIVEVRTRTPVKVTYDPVLIAGRLEVLRDDPMGVYYRIGNGESLPIR